IQLAFYSSSSFSVSLTSNDQSPSLDLSRSSLTPFSPSSNASISNSDSQKNDLEIPPDFIKKNLLEKIRSQHNELNHKLNECETQYTNIKTSFDSIHATAVLEKVEFIEWFFDMLPEKK